MLWCHANAANHQPSISIIKLLCQAIAVQLKTMKPTQDRKTLKWFGEREKGGVRRRGRETALSPQLLTPQPGPCVMFLDALQETRMLLVSRRFRTHTRGWHSERSHPRVNGNKCTCQLHSAQQSRPFLRDFRFQNTTITQSLHRWRYNTLAVIVFVHSASLGGGKLSLCQHPPHKLSYRPGLVFMAHGEALSQTKVALCIFFFPCELWCIVSSHLCGLGAQTRYFKRKQKCFTKMNGNVIYSKSEQLQEDGKQRRVNRGERQATARPGYSTHCPCPDCRGHRLLFG